MTKTFNDLYTHELQMLLSAETQMIELLPRLAEGIDTPELQRAVSTQVQTCKKQSKLLKELLKALGQSSSVPVNGGIRSLLAECTEVLKSFATGNLRDAVMIAHMQRAEHYKMASYASVQAYAKLLGDDDGAECLGGAAKAVTGMSKTLGAIAIQVDAEAYVDTRVEGT